MMNQEQSRMRTSTDEIIEVSEEEEMDDFVESSGDFDESEEDLTESAEEEEIEWMELERASARDTHEPVESRPEPLLRSQDLDELRSRWSSIQASFVDEPRSSVEQADVLVAEVMERIVGMFSEKRSLLDEQWADQDDVSTEDLRVALQRYRSFFNRLLSL